MSENPQVPAHRGVIKARIFGGTGEIMRVQFTLTPCTLYSPRVSRLEALAGWHALEGDHLMRDDGKGGDETAKDGIFTSDNLCSTNGDFRVEPGRYVLRVMVHDERNAVAVDVDGVEITK